MNASILLSIIAAVSEPAIAQTQKHATISDLELLKLRYLLAVEGSSVEALITENISKGRIIINEKGEIIISATPYELLQENGAIQSMTATSSGSCSRSDGVGN